MTDDPVARHEKSRHPYSNSELAAMVLEHRQIVDEMLPKVNRMMPQVEEMAADVLTIVEEMHGELRPTLTDPDNRTGGFVEKIEHIDQRSQIQAEKIDKIYEVVGNGGMKLKLSAGAWTAVTAIIVALGVIAGALITALVGG
jgi:hypothetical protein